MKRLPPPTTWVLRLLLPEEYAEDVVDDLEDRWQERSATRPGGAYLWLAREILQTPFVGLRRQARRLRRSGVRRPEDRTRHDTGLAAGKVATGLAISLRSLAKRRSFTAAATLTLVASIGSSTLIFSVLEGVLLRPLPFPDDHRLHYVHGTNAAWRDSEDDFLRRSWQSYALTEDMIDVWRGAASDVETIGGFARATVFWSDGDTPTIRSSGAWILPGVFETLGVQPVLGRFPTPSDFEGESSVIVIGDALWGSRYGRDPDVLGATVTIEDRVLEIVGVAPAEMELPGADGWWAPVGEDFADGRSNASIFHAVARLRPGVPAVDAEESMNRLVEKLAEGDPDLAGIGARLQTLRSVVVDDVSGGIRLLFWSVALVVLIASVNLANLMLVRGAERRGELAMRAALGASRADLLWTTVSEVLVVCAIGGATGVLVATQALGPFLALLARAAPSFPRIDNVSVNPLVLGFSLAVTLLTVLIAGLLPGLAASGRAPWETLQGARRGGTGAATRRTQSGLLFSEATMAILLLTVAGLLTRSAVHVLGIDSGMDDRAVAYVQVRTAPERYAGAQDVLTLTDEVTARLAQTPWAAYTAWADAVPSLGGTSMNVMRPEGGDAQSAQLIGENSVSTDYFTALGIPIVRGRGFTRDDDADAPPVAIVSELFALRIFGSADEAVGRTVRVARGTRLEGGRLATDAEDAVTIVGVVPDVRQLALVVEPEPMLYRPLAQSPSRSPSLVIRAEALAPREIIETARDVVLEVDPTVFVGDVGVLRGSMQRAMAPLFVRTVLVVAIAVLAGFLTIVGIYGVVAYVVSDQVREIGLRMALGARSTGEEWRMVLSALKPVLLGALAGLCVARLGGAYLEGQLVGIVPSDIPTSLAVLCLLGASAAVAAWLPARRAATVDPARVLND